MIAQTLTGLQGFLRKYGPLNLERVQGLRFAQPRRAGRAGARTPAGTARAMHKRQSTSCGSGRELALMHASTDRDYGYRDLGFERSASLIQQA